LVTAIQFAINNDHPDRDWYATVVLTLELLTPILILAAVLYAAGWVVQLLGHIATRR
jgi:hypothetical protein